MRQHFRVFLCSLGFSHMVIKNPFRVIQVFILLGNLGIINQVSYAQTTSEAELSEEAKQGYQEFEGERARVLFKEQCARCHGIRGDGRGSLASYLSPRPTDLTNPVWYKSTSPEKLKWVILGGGGALGKSVLMPAYPKLRDQPKLISALIDYIIALAPREEEEKKESPKK